MYDGDTASNLPECGSFCDRANRRLPRQSENEQAAVVYVKTGFLSKKDYQSILEVTGIDASAGLSDTRAAEYLQTICSINPSTIIHPLLEQTQALIQQHGTGETCR